MQTQISKFDEFLKQKKNAGNLAKGDKLPQFLKDDQEFEAAHNSMLTKHRTFKNMLP
jgi:hypothetical protein